MTKRGNLNCCVCGKPVPGVSVTTGGPTDYSVTCQECAEARGLGQGEKAMNDRELVRKRQIEQRAVEDAWWDGAEIEQRHYLESCWREKTTDWLWISHYYRVKPKPVGHSVTVRYTFLSKEVADNFMEECLRAGIKCVREVTE